MAPHLKPLDYASPPPPAPKLRRFFAHGALSYVAAGALILNFVLLLAMGFWHEWNSGAIVNATLTLGTFFTWLPLVLIISHKMERR